MADSWGSKNELGKYCGWYRTRRHSISYSLPAWLHLDSSLLLLLLFQSWALIVEWCSSSSESFCSGSCIANRPFSARKRWLYRWDIASWTSLLTFAGSSQLVSLFLKDLWGIESSHRSVGIASSAPQRACMLVAANPFIIVWKVCWCFGRIASAFDERILDFCW